MHQGLRLYDEALVYIENHPKEWTQASYRCNTGMCIAGHIAVTIAGGEHSNPFDELDDELVATPEEARETWNYTIPTSTRARTLLGDAYVPGMFDAGNNLAQLKNYRDIAARQVGEK